MSRATLHALRLDFRTAFAYHPMWVTLPFFGFFLLFFRYKRKKALFRATLVLFAALMIGVYLYRMLGGVSQHVVTFDPQSGAIARLVLRIKEAVA